MSEDNSYVSQLKRIAATYKAVTEADVTAAKSVMDCLKLIAKGHGVLENVLEPAKSISDVLTIIADYMEEPAST